MCLKFGMHLFPKKWNPSLSLSLLDVTLYQTRMRREIVRTHGLEQVLYRSWFLLCLQVKEIEQEVHAGPETVQQKDIKQTAAADLSKRLQDFRSLNNASSLKGNCFLYFLSFRCFVQLFLMVHTEKLYICEMVIWLLCCIK
jgi:hypothetical protein